MHKPGSKGLRHHQQGDAMGAVEILLFIPPAQDGPPQFNRKRPATRDTRHQLVIMGVHDLLHHGSHQADAGGGFRTRQCAQCRDLAGPVQQACAGEQRGIEVHVRRNNT